MAIYHLSIKIITRGKGKSAVAAAAYRAGELLRDNHTGLMHDYTRKGGVVMSEIILPEYAPEHFSDRETLWNEVQLIEKNANAQLAREIEIALPNELERNEQIECIRDFIWGNFVSKGMRADWVLHDTGRGNPHTHILLTTRQFKKDGNWDVKKRNAYVFDENGDKIPVIDKKTGLQKVEKKSGRKVWMRQTIEVNDWNSPDKAEQWRSSWAETVNLYLDPGHKVDHRSYKRQGLDVEPTIHEGYVARDMERKGKNSDRCEENCKIRERNSIRDNIRKLFDVLTTIIVEKVRELYGRLTSITGYDRHPGESTDLDRDVRGSTGTVGRTYGRESEIESTDRFIEATESEISRSEQAVGRLKTRKESENNERINRLIARQRALFGGGDDGAGREDEGKLREQDQRSEEDDIGQGQGYKRSEIDDLLRDLKAEEERAGKERDDSLTERTDRDVSKLRQRTEGSIRIKTAGYGYAEEPEYQSDRSRQTKERSGGRRR